MQRGRGRLATDHTYDLILLRLAATGQAAVWPAGKNCIKWTPWYHRDLTCVPRRRPGDAANAKGAAGCISKTADGTTCLNAVTRFALLVEKVE